MTGRGPITADEAARLEREGAPAPGRTIKAWGKADNERWERALRNREYVDAVLIAQRPDGWWVRYGPCSLVGGMGSGWCRVASRIGPRPGERVVPYRWRDATEA